MQNICNTQKPYSFTKNTLIYVPIPPFRVPLWSSNVHIVGQNPRGRQLSVKVCGNNRTTTMTNQKKFGRIYAMLRPGFGVV